MNQQLSFHDRVNQAMQAEREQIGELAWSIMTEEDKLELRKQVAKRIAMGDISGNKYGNK